MLLDGMQSDHALLYPRRVLESEISGHVANHLE